MDTKKDVGFGVGLEIGDSEPLSQDTKFLHGTILIFFFSQGEVERGRQLIHEGIALRKELGVPLYVAAGYCDLGREYYTISMLNALLHEEISLATCFATNVALPFAKKFQV